MPRPRMSPSRRSRSSTRRPSSTPPPLSSSATLLASLLLCPLFTSAQSSLPDVDFSKMGSVALGGSFAGLDFYSPSSSSSSSNISYSSSASTLVLRSASSSSISPLAQTNEGGFIDAVCYLAGEGTNGTVFVGGSFSELGGVPSTNVAKIDLSTGQVASLGAGGVEGSIRTLYCDNSTSEGVVWIGGDLTTPLGVDAASSSSYGGGVLQYLPSSDTFAPAPFTGLAKGAVQSISLSSTSNSSLLFTGSFSLSYSGSFNVSSSTNASSNSTTQFSPSGLPLSNVTILSPGATAFSSTLSPIPLLGPGVLVDAEPTTVLEGYTDPSVLFCPTGADGINHSWLGRDQGIAQINVQVYTAITASGIRVGNTFVNGRGTSAFSFVSVPDNTLLSLSYLNTSTGATETCSSSCPLSLNSSIPFQDFLFADGGRDLTGFQMNLLEWREEGPGLHLLELLSDGAYASAASSNTTACSSLDSPSNATTVGTWTEITISTSIGGTTTTALQSIVPSSEIATLSTPPSVTFRPYLSGTGNYTVNVLVPGCLNVGDCSSRTSLDVSIQPYQGASLWTSTIPPTQHDLTFLLYQGAIQKSEDGGFSPTVVLAMSSTPVGVNADEYSVVANRVEFQLTTLDTTGTGSNSSTSANGTTIGTGGVNGTSGTNSSSTIGAFGLYEWNRSSRETNATGLLSNSTQTDLEKLGVALALALKASTLSTSPSISSAVLLDSVHYVAGSFGTSAFSNIVSYDGSSIGVLPNKGLNGAVHSMVVVGSKVFVGGDFTASLGQALLRLASYDTSSKSWEALGGGVDGAVTGLVVSGTRVFVSGNFSTLLAANSTSSSTSSGGFAVWDTTSSSWVSQQAVILGDVAIVGAGAGGDAYFAGNILGAAGFGADSFVTLSSGSDGAPAFNAVPLSFASLSSSSSSSANTTVSRRSASRRSHPSSASNWLSISSVAAIKRTLFQSRQTTSTSSTPSVPAIPRTATPAPAVLAAAFWTNSSESGSPSINIIGGNFSSDLAGQTSLSSSNNVALYDPSTKAIRALDGGVVDGIVYALEVVGDRVFIGGEFRVNSTTGLDEEGLAIWDLKARQWVAGEMPGLSAAAGFNVTVNALRTRGTTSTLVVAGSFAEAGSLPCASICAWDTTEHQWTSLNNGLSGEIRAFDFAGASSEILVVAGSFSLPSSSTASFVAQYSFSNSSWSALGDSSSIPGPATVISVDNKNATNIFIAGTSSSSNASYLLRWDGSTWASPAGVNILESTSVVQQLSFVPLTKAHDGNSVMENDRMLMVSGALALNGQGTYSTALYDGSSWHPYVKSTASDGSPGAVAGVFNSNNSFSFSIRSFLARGLVVLICIAIATGLLFLFVLIGVLVSIWRRKRDENRTYPIGKGGDGRDSYSDVNASPAVNSNSQSSRARSALLDHIDLATAGVITGGAASGAAAFAEHEKSRTQAQSDYEHNPVSESTAVARGAASSDEQHGEEQEEEAYTEEEEQPLGRIATARWSLEPDVGAERELRIRAGQPYIILNDTDPQGEWWLAMDPETGEEGAVPASWML